MLRHSINQGMHYVTSYFLVHCIYLAFKKKKYLIVVFENLNKWVQLALFDSELLRRCKITVVPPSACWSIRVVRLARLVCFIFVL